MSGYLSLEEVKQDFLKKGVGNIMNATFPVHTTTPKSLRSKPISSVVGDKK